MLSTKPATTAKTTYPLPARRFDADKRVSGTNPQAEWITSGLPATREFVATNDREPL
jgi:hypothetical protein